MSLPAAWKCRRVGGRWSEGRGPAKGRAGLAPPWGGATIWFLSLGCAGRVARYLFHVRSRRADVSYGVVKGWFAGCRFSTVSAGHAGASFLRRQCPGLQGFPRWRGTGCRIPFFSKAVPLPSVVIAGILRADAVPEKPLPRAGAYRDRIVDKKIPPFCGGIFTCDKFAAGRPCAACPTGGVLISRTIRRGFRG